MFDVEFGKFLDEGIKDLVKVGFCGKVVGVDFFVI